MSNHTLPDDRCSFWELDVNDGPPDPLSGTARSPIASMGSIAVGFGSMLAAPSKALYAVAVQKRKGADGETSSINSEKSAEFDPQPIRKGFLRKATSMQRSLSDQSSGSSINPRS